MRVQGIIYICTLTGEVDKICSVIKEWENMHGNGVGNNLQGCTMCLLLYCAKSARLCVAGLHSDESTVQGN